MSPARPRPVAKAGDGHITIASEPRCEVLVDGVPYGATPVIDLAVPAGKHAVVLLNSAANIRETQKIVLREGELWTRSFTFEGGKSQMQNGLSSRMLAGTTAAQPSATPAKVEPVAAKSEAPAVAAVPAAHAPTPAQAAPASAPHPVEGATSKPNAPTAVASMAAQKPRNVNQRTLDSQQLSHADPHLPANVRSQRSGTGDARFMGKVCVNTEGKVYSVNVLSGIPGGDESIVSTIKSWTYKPQPVSVCFVANFVFDLQ
jgi:uncharacterized protein (DUF2147 family)